MKTPTQLLHESDEHGKIILFASDYKDAHPEMDGYVSTVMLADILEKFKTEFIDKEWYNAGIMAQRILQNDEIESLKKRLYKEDSINIELKDQLDNAITERDELKIRCKALEDRIAIITNK